MNEVQFTPLLDFMHNSHRKIVGVSNKMPIRLIFSSFGKRVIRRDIGITSFHNDPRTNQFEYADKSGIFSTVL